MNKVVGKAAVKARGGKVSSVLSNQSAAYLLTFAFGEQEGTGGLAKVNAALAFQTAVRSGKLKVDDAGDAATGYDAGKAKAQGREPSAPGSLTVLKSQFGSFANEHAVAFGPAAYKAADAAIDKVAAKDRDSYVTDAFQRYLKLNKVAKETGKAPTADAIAVAIKKKEAPAKSADAIIKAMMRDAKELRAMKLDKAKAAALKEFIAAFA